MTKLSKPACVSSVHSSSMPSETVRMVSSIQLMQLLLSSMGNLFACPAKNRSTAAGGGFSLFY